MSLLALFGIIGLGLLILVVSWKGISRWLTKPYYHRKQTIDDIEGFFRSLRVQIGDNGVLIIRHKSSGRFIQFIKYANKGRAYLHFSMPETKWSENAFPAILKLCREKGFSCRFQDVDGPFIKRFLDVELDFSNEDAAHAALAFSKEVLLHLGLSEQDRFSIHIRGDSNHEYTQGLVREALQNAPPNSLKRRMVEWSAKTLEKPGEHSN